MTFEIILLSIAAVAFVVGMPIVVVWSFVDLVRGKGRERRGGGGNRRLVVRNRRLVRRLLAPFGRGWAVDDALPGVGDVCGGVELRDCAVERLT